MGKLGKKSIKPINQGFAYLLLAPEELVCERLHTDSGMGLGGRAWTSSLINRERQLQIHESTVDKEQKRLEDLSRAKLTP